MLSIVIFLLSAQAVAVNSFIQPRITPSTSTTTTTTTTTAICASYPSPGFYQRRQSQHHPSSSSSSSSSSLVVLHASKRRGGGGGGGGGGGAMSRRRKTKGGSGFGQRTEEKEESESDDNDSSSSIYSLPPLYDLAFGYRNYDDEVNFLLDVHHRYSSNSKQQQQHSITDIDVDDDDEKQPGGLRILELAAGPARHSLAALSEHPPSEVDSIVALDLSREMVKYGMENADHELGSHGGGRRDDFAYVVGDMRNADDFFVATAATTTTATASSPTTLFDAAWLLLGSMQHLLTNDDVIACLSSISSALVPAGTVVIELPHPRETFSMGECTRNGWTVPLVEDDEEEEEKEYGELKIVWGEEGDEFDPVAQVRQFTVEMELTVNDNAGDDDASSSSSSSSPSLMQTMTSKEGKTKVREVVPMRLFTLQEIDALARCAGLEMVARYGALDTEEVNIEDEEEAFRMVCILRKKKDAA